jgi:uncharacterized protein YbjT (DUF2867 family)
MNRIAIAGASGFVGTLLLDALPSDLELIALGRRAQVKNQEKLSRQIEWRSCDLFSLLQTEQALQGVDVAIYLIHSMLPRAALNQSSFEDCDLLLADNFARAAQKNGVKRIIYLGGLIPPGKELSKHLMSRLEVESALASRGTPVTTLRAGMILGAQGSSFQILYTLVKRLPVMLCPGWTQTMTQAIAAEDVIALIAFCLKTPETTGKTYDIGAPDRMSYRDLMSTLADEMKIKRRMIPVPLFSPGLSRLWVSLMTGASRNLVGPLVMSLKHEMIVHNRALLELYGKPLRSIREAMQLSLINVRPNLKSETKLRLRALEGGHLVRSIQRITILERAPAIDISRAYFYWLKKLLPPVIRVFEKSQDEWHIYFFTKRIELLVLGYDSARSTSDRALFYIRSGLLVDRNQPTNARMEFRQVLQGQEFIVAIHDFRPALPWMIYKYTQALAHLWVMGRFRAAMLSRRG